MMKSLTVRDEHGMICPRCKLDTHLEVVYSAWTLLVPDGTDDINASEHDHDWDTESPCRCRACNWTGIVADAEYAADIDAAIALLRKHGWTVTDPQGQVA